MQIIKGKIVLVNNADQQCPIAYSVFSFPLMALIHSRRKVGKKAVFPNDEMKCLAKCNPTTKDTFSHLLERIVTSVGDVQRRPLVERFVYTLAHFSTTKPDFSGLK